MASKRLLAQKHEHEVNNTGHVVRFSIHDSAWWCGNCDWMDFAHISEPELDKLVMAEYEKSHCSQYYNTEMEAIREANFHH